MKEIIDKLPSMKRDLALDVGCGECNLTEDLLKHEFKKIILLEKDKKLYEKANEYINK